MAGDSKGKIGNFELLETVGDGAEGRVYRARYVGRTRDGLESGEIVALKRLKDAGNREHTDSFRRSAKILSQLNHPNIVRYKDYVVFHDEQVDAELYCLVTEFLSGKSLKQLIDDSPQGLPWDLAREIMGSTLRALVYAAGLPTPIIHRDLKPSNIYVVEGQVPKLIDFGIARFEDAGSTTTSTSTGFKGSFDYMAPEFGRPDKYTDFHGDAQSDIYSFGVCFYQVLTGKLPFETLSKGGGRPELRFVMRCNSPAPKPSLDHPLFLVWPSIGRCIARCLNFDRGVRYPSFAEVLKDFEKFRRRTLGHRGTTYEFMEFLGRGGFGRVFRARDNAGRSVAVKEMIADRQSDRFEREAKLLQKAAHPHLVRYLDFIKTDDEAGSDLRRLFLVLEYLEGMPAAGLNQRIRKSHAGIDLIEVLRMFGNYLDCLHHLHGIGIFHRDIKPGNLYAPTGEPENAKIFDLGIAYDAEGTRTRGQIPGTLDYMPPEFAAQDGERGTAQSDIFSLGVTLYQALTKNLPFPRLPTTETEAWVAFYQRAQAVDPPSPDFDYPVFRAEAGLESAVRQSLEFDPGRRQRSAAEMRDQLLGIVQRIERRQTYERELAAARAAVEAQDWEEAGRAANQALAIFPGEPAAVEIRDHATAQLRQRQVDKFVAECRGFLEQGRWLEAGEAVRRGLEFAPKDPSLQEFHLRVEAWRRAEQKRIEDEKKRLAEQARLEEEQKQLAERKRLEEEAQRVAEEAKRAAEQAKRAEEAKRAAEAAKRAEEEEKRKAEEAKQRVAEMAKRAEQARLAAEKAAALTDEGLTVGDDGERPTAGTRDSETVGERGTEATKPFKSEKKEEEEPDRPEPVVVLPLDRGPRWPWILAILVVLLSTAVATVLFLRAPRRPESAAGGDSNRVQGGGTGAIAVASGSTSGPAQGRGQPEVPPARPPKVEAADPDVLALEQETKAARDAWEGYLKAAGPETLETARVAVSNLAKKWPKSKEAQDLEKTVLAKVREEEAEVAARIEKSRLARVAREQEDKKKAELVEKVRDLTTRAKAALLAKNWKEAQARAREIQGLQPKDQEAEGILREATTAIAGEEASYRAAISSATTARNAKDWVEVERQAGEALRLRPEDAAAKDLLNQAGKANAQYDQSVKTGRQSLGAGDPAAALRSATNAIALRKDVAEAEKLRKDAQAALDANVEQGRKLATATQRARQALTEKRWDDAIAAAQDALVIRPGDAEATRLLTEARERKQAAVDLARRHDELVDAGRKALDAGNRSEALRLAGEALKLRPDSATALSLQADANRPAPTPPVTQPVVPVADNSALTSELLWYKIRFGVVENTDNILDAKGKKLEKFRGSIQERALRANVDALREKMRAAGILDANAARDIEDVLKKIRNWNGGGF